MELLTDKIKYMMPKLGSTEKTPCDEKEFIVKFFNPMGDWTWLVAEGEKQEDGDWLFFGLVDGFEKEWGYFSLSELEAVDVGFGMGIERDIMYGPEWAHPEWAAMGAN